MSVATTGSADADWKLDYCNVERLSSGEMARLRAEFDRDKAEARRVREASGVVPTEVKREIE